MAYIPTTSYHTTLSVSRFKQSVDCTIRWVQELQSRIKFSHIVCTGISGAAIAWPVSYYTRVPVIVVRKPNEVSHGQEVEAFESELTHYIIIDDFIHTGDTIQRIAWCIQNRIASWNKDKNLKVDCKAILLHNSDRKHEFYNLKTGQTRVPVISTQQAFREQDLDRIFIK